MPLSHMLSAVCQTVALSALEKVISHHLLLNAFASATEHQVFTEWSSVMEAARVNATAANATTVNSAAVNITGGNTTLGNVTLTNVTLATAAISPPAFANGKQSFYFRVLPREIFLIALICPLQYYWQLWLERCLPSRSASKVAISHGNIGGGEKDANVNDDDSREEEIVKKWIAQGKVRRASLSWVNTLLKWIIDINLGTLWSSTLYYLLEELLAWRMFEAVKGLHWQMLALWFTSFFGLDPLVSLISFIVVPAYKRIVFKAGLALIWGIFCAASVGVFIPWAMDTQFVQKVFHNMTEEIKNNPGGLPNGNVHAEL